MIINPYRAPTDESLPSNVLQISIASIMVRVNILSSGILKACRVFFVKSIVYEPGLFYYSSRMYFMKNIDTNGIDR